MKTVSKFFTRLMLFCSAVSLFTACVEDDDFDAPVIPPVQEVEEIISEGGANAAFVSCLNEDFENYDADITNFGAYENVTTYDTRLWSVESFGGNKYLKLSAYKAKGNVYSYFVIPVNFDKADQFSFTTQDRFFTGDALKVLIVEDYKIENNITKAKMTDITGEFKIATGNTGSSTNAKLASGVYDLSKFKGNGFIAFKYEGNGSNITTTIHIDDINIIDKDDADCKSSGGGTTTPTDGCGGSTAQAISCLNEDFESYEKDAISFNKFFNASQKGDQKTWKLTTFGGNKYIQMSAYKSGEEDDWFIIPVDFDKADEFSFETKAGFDNGKVLKIYTSTEHNGSCTVTESQWTDITSNFDIATGPSSGYGTDYTPSKAYSLSSLTGKGYIAFRYVGNGSGGTTTTMQIENIKLVDKDDTNCYNKADTQTHKGGNESTPASCLVEDFETEMTDKMVFSKYETISISSDGDETYWRQTEYQNNKYIQHSAHKKGKQDDWFLVEVNFDKADQMSFETKDGFYNGKVLTVLYSTTHTKGNDVKENEWVDITSEFTIASGSEKFGAAFIPSGDYKFPASLAGNGFVAFRYQGDSNAGLTTTMQIDNIKITDVDDSTCYGEKDECSKEEFNNFAKNDTELTGYQTINTKGTRKWTVNEVNGNKLIEETAFNSGAVSSWFIMGVNFDTAASIQFDSKDGYNNGKVLTVLYSTDYDENGDPTTATWTDITSKFNIANAAPNNDFATNFTASGAYNFTNLTGKGYVAFKYDGEQDKGFTTTMQIDNIRLGKKDENSTASCSFNLKELTTAPPTNTQIHKGGQDAQPLGCYNLDFKDVASNTDSFNNFEIISVKGNDALWKSNAHNNNSFLQMRGYQVGEQDDWVLIHVDFNKADTFSFKTQDGYNNGQPLTVWYSTTHTKGNDITESDWTEITSNFDIAKDAPSNGYASSFTDSKEYSLSGISGNGFIAFRYKGGDNKVTTTMRIDDIKIIDNEDSNCGSTTPPPTGNTVTDKLFFSEYAEGASNDKYIEIYNPTTDEIDLTRYEIRLSNHSKDDWSSKYTFEAGKTLASKTVYSIANPQANDDIKAKATDVKGNVTSFNGDDALGLFFDADGDGTFETLLDIIGVKTNDPGSGWEVAGVANATKDHTLVRKPSIEKGNADWSTSAGTNADDSEWIVKDKGDFSSLGER